MIKKIYALVLISLLFILLVLTDGTIQNNKTIYFVSFILFSIGAVYELNKDYKKKGK